MSRRSLRIDDSLLDRSLPHSSASFSVGGGTAGWKNRSHSSRRLSSSCSESLLLHTPRKQNPLNSTLNSTAVNSSGVHSAAASDASLLSSLLDESSIQESTAVDGFWGLDHDSDPKESTMVCDQSTITADDTVIGPDTSSSKRSALIGPDTSSSKRSALIGPDTSSSKRSALIGPDPLCGKLSKAHCEDGEQQTDPKYSGPSGTTASTCSSASLRPRTRPGTTLGASSGAQDPEETQETPTIYCRGRRHRGVLLLLLWLRRWVSCLLSALMGLHQHLQKHHELTDVLQLWLDSSLSHLKRAALLCGSALTFTWRQVCQCRGHAPRRLGGRFCSVMKETKENQANGALTKTAAGVFRWIRRKWHQMNTDGNNTRFPLGFVLFLLLLFVFIFSLLWCGPSLLSSVSISELPFLQMLTSQTETETESGPPGPPGPGRTQSTAVQTWEEPEEPEEPEETEPGPEPASAEEKEEQRMSSDLDSSRLERLEQSLSSLWQQMEVRGHDPRADPGQSDQDLDLYMSSVLEQQLDHIRTRLEEDHRLWEQARQCDQEQQQTHSLRLDQMELQLQALTKRTEELERKQAAALRDLRSSVPAALSSGVESQSQDLLFTELSHLQGALQTVRQEVEALSGCRGRCSQLENLQDMLSSQVSVLVQEDVRSLIFGSQLSLPRDSLVSKSVLQFISERFVSEEGLQGALSALELRIMEHIHRHMEQKKRSEEEMERRREPGGAVTQEEVQEMVQKALRQFSEDRTGLADYALESGGGSILSTRCSQTYETKTALLSLFGFPLWYFSQSPRVVIQPDVQPGNCWPFRGPSGTVVIRLSMRILPSGFSLEHVPRSLSPSGTLRSAPKDFSVYGLRDEDEEEGTLLGTYLYDQDGDALQTYAVSEENQESFQIVLVKVLSNWGHEDYTCMYRFRVHGTPTETEPDQEQDQEENQEQDQEENQEQDQDKDQEQD